jgi:hypothetical protein
VVRRLLAGFSARLSNDLQAQSELQRDASTEVCICPISSGRRSWLRPSWVRLGAVELGLDCLRRWLQGRLVGERIDFDKI